MVGYPEAIFDHVRLLSGQYRIVFVNPTSISIMPSRAGHNVGFVGFLRGRESRGELRLSLLTLWRRTFDAICY